ncbi:serine/threonine protein phosphatase [Candidatus Woesearchaeota archaeon]|nr:serine/threonine protein phosphatase [Candidatus Woesearchaeota archaeon]
MSATTPTIVVGIGDLHGYLPALDGILEKLNDQYALFPTEGKLREDAQLVFCGDYIDRGSESRQLIERIIALERNNENIRALCGNHELLALAALDTARSLAENGPEGLRRQYYQRTVHGYNGGLALVNNYLKDSTSSQEAFRELAQEFSRDGPIGRWLRERPAGIVHPLEGKELLFVHGGIPLHLGSREELEELLERYRQHMFTQTEKLGGTQRKFLEHPLVGEQSLFWVRDTPRQSRERVAAQLAALHVDYVIFGHTPKKRITMFHDRLFDIDVGMSSAYGAGDPAALAFTKEGIFAVYKSQKQPEKLKEL